MSRKLKRFLQCNTIILHYQSTINCLWLFSQSLTYYLFIQMLPLIFGFYHFVSIFQLVKRGTMATFQISFNDAHTKNTSSTFAPSKFAFYHFSCHVSLSLDVILLQIVWSVLISVGITVSFQKILCFIKFSGHVSCIVPQQIKIQFISYG